jgi:hypothetical protein
MKERGSQQNALARFILCSHLSLAREKGIEKLVCVSNPPRGLRPQRQQNSIVPVERKITDRIVSYRGLRKPNVLICLVG